MTAPPARGDEREHRPVRPGALVALGIICALIVLGIWKARGPNRLRINVTERLEYVMSTHCSITAVVPADRTDQAQAGINRAEAAIRTVQVRMNPHLERTELERLNSAPAGELVPLSSETLHVLRRAKQLHAETRGAFDVTVMPLLETWKSAAREKRLPDVRELAEAREASRWDLLQLSAEGATKLRDSVRVDLGGIAKGYAIDQAVEAIQGVGVTAGLVNIGGDLRVFGRPTTGEFWSVPVRDPFGGGERDFFAVLRIRDAAVATSGNYARSFEIEGKRYSHIIDPVSGRPVDAVPSVTVVAPDALTADAWATALSVLGAAGLDLLVDHPNVHALVISDARDDHQWHTTPGFEKFFKDAPKTGESSQNAVAFNAALAARRTAGPAR